jgi:Predicted transcriptional regulators
MKNFEYVNGVCPVGAAVAAIGGKWKIAILWNLREGSHRFSELHRKLPGKISQAVLTSQLRELEKDGLIHREIFKEIPPRVEYSLTEVGTAFLPVIISMGEWSESYLLKY